MNKLVKETILLSLLIFTLQLHGQVTIGSDTPPRTGALLDLTQGDITNKGLNLPRVSLKSLTAKNNDLRTTIDSVDTSAGDPWGLTEHEGLVVYNVNEENCSDLVPGTYVWMGDKWEPLSKSSFYESISNDLYLPNCYLVSPNTTTFQFPIKKAFAIWEYYGWDKVGRLPTETITGTLSATLYWQDTGIVNSVSISGNKRDDKITVNLNGGGTKGNAVIALKDGTGTIRWSWHIWVTDDPTNGNLIGNGLQWMDRFLGATSNEVANPKSIGLHYQWGRKDPFPGYSNFSGGVTAITGEVSAVNLSYTSNSNRQGNFKQSITNPISFIRTATGNFDWYSYNESDPKLRWDDRWSKDECGEAKKSSFDPCPEGWKVPTYEDSDNQFPWRGLGTYKDSPYWVTGEYGYTWTVTRGVSSSIGNFGYYPATGYRSGGSGGLISEVEGQTRYGTNGYAWTGTPSIHATSGFIGLSLHYTGRESGYTKPEVHTWGYNTNPGAGYPVRCIKE